MIKDIFSDEEFFVVSSAINYWVGGCAPNAVEKASLPLEKEGQNIMGKINSILEEKKFFEEWNVYEKDNQTDFSILEINAINQYIDRSLRSWEQNNSDILALFNKDELVNLNNKLEGLGSVLSSLDVSKNIDPFIFKNGLVAAQPGAQSELFHKVLQRE